MTESLLEELSLNAWPALQTAICDGWLLRLAHGYTRRSNSVTPLYPSTLPLAAKIAYCETLYQAHDQPCIFKLTSTWASLDALLASRGYTQEALTSVQAASLSGHYRSIDPEPLSDEWLQAFFRLNGLDPRHLLTAGVLLDHNPFPKALLAIREGGEIIATGLAVLDRAWVGLFDIAVAASHRRRGLGRHVTEALLAWGQAKGAQYAYLQVVCDNLPAVDLYRSVGFREVYRYWYRRRKLRYDVTRAPR
jgi:N-acetylglutamate synthase